MYGVNDVFDYESDIQNPRKGGVEGAKVAKKYHSFVLRAATLINIPFLLYLLIIGSLASNIVLTMVTFFVIAYSAPPLRFKERAFLDSVTSSLHFVGPAIFAISLAQPRFDQLPIIVAFFLWGMASHAFGAVQDITFDRKAGIGSIATIIGAKWTVNFAIILYTLSALVLSVYSTALVPIALCVMLYALNIHPYRAVSDKKSAITNIAWRRFIWLNWLTGAVVTITTIILRT